MKKAMTVALVAALVAGGCGGEDEDENENQSAEEAAQAYVTALQELDFETACGFFPAEELEARMGGLEACMDSMEATTPENALEGFEITGTTEGEDGQTIVEFVTDAAPPNSFELMTEAQFEEFEAQEKAAETGNGKEAEAEAEAEADADAEAEAEEGEGSEEDRWVFFEG